MPFNKEEREYDSWVSEENRNRKLEDLIYMWSSDNLNRSLKRLFQLQFKEKIISSWEKLIVSPLSY